AGTAARFSQPVGMARDNSGNIYVADFTNNAIRKVTPGGVVSTFAGQPTAGTADGIGTNAHFSNPSGVAIDGSGNLYVTDSSNNEIREITSLGVVTTVAGQPAPGATDGTGTAASFTNPVGIAFDSGGNLLIADSGNDDVRAMTPGALVTTAAGGLQNGTADGTGSTAQFSSPSG